jgi:hypothetical protein
MDHAANEALTTEIGGVDIKSGQFSGGNERLYKTVCKNSMLQKCQKTLVGSVDLENGEGL